RDRPGRDSYQPAEAFRSGPRRCVDARVGPLLPSRPERGVVVPGAAADPRLKGESMRIHLPLKRRGVALTAALLGALGLAAIGAAPASAASYPVNYSFANGFVAGFLFPDSAPAGANNWSCKPGSAHPYPVVLVHGTVENMNDNWGGASPLLADNGYCVFAFD